MLKDLLVVDARRVTVMIIISITMTRLDTTQADYYYPPDDIVRTECAKFSCAYRPFTYSPNMHTDSHAPQKKTYERPAAARYTSPVALFIVRVCLRLWSGFSK